MRRLTDLDNRPLITLFIIVAVGVGAFYWGRHGSALRLEEGSGNGFLLSVSPANGPAYFVITPDGRVGIGSNHPTAPLEVGGPIRLTKKSVDGCNPATEGAIAYNPDNKHFWGCDGSAWRVLDGN